MTALKLVHFHSDGLDGPTNMAFDEFLWKAASSNTIYLRTYRWDGPWLSLGYFQTAQEMDNPRWHSLPWVRRQTGGGAIVHDHDVTYSLCMPRSHVSSDPRDLYAAMHHAFAQELKQHGIQATIGFESDLKERRPFLCFERTDRDAVTIQGVKILGSAQRTDQNSILMHGSVILQQSRWTPELPGIRDVTNNTIPDDAISKSFLTTAEKMMGGDFENGVLSEDEWNEVKRVAGEKYAGSDWLFKR